MLREHFADRKHVLEIGSGTGQHAVHFAAALPFLQWQASEREEHLPGLRLWLDEAALPNTPVPVPLDVQGLWPAGPFDAVFSANTLHIMSWNQVQQLFARLPAVTTADAKLVIYGPFHVDGQRTAPSNAQFDASLRQRSPHMGIRDTAAVDALATTAGFTLHADVEMPACNLCRIWQRSTNVGS